MTEELTGTVWRRSIMSYLLKDRFPTPAVYGLSSRP